MKNLSEDDLVSPEQAPNSETMQRFLEGYKRIPPSVGVAIHLPDPSTGMPPSATHTFTRRQFEALAYGWNMFTNADDSDMLQLVEMGYLCKPGPGFRGSVYFKRTESGNALSDYLCRGEIVLTITAKGRP